MSRSIEQNLLSLMPTHGNQLPHRLVDTARTLLTQSRQRASTLKADEEVARMYACAHIACERLKTTLDLPPIEPRPPIPPRVYKRLFTHLDNILPGRQPRFSISTPESKTQRPLGSAVKRSPPRALDRSVSRSATKVTPKQITLVHTPSKSTGRGFVGRVDPGVGLQPWIRGVLGVLISEFGQQAWGRIVLAGVQHVVAPGNRRTRDEWVSAHIPATVAAIFAVSMHAVDVILSGTAAGGPRARKEMAERTVDCMRRARQELDVKGLSDDEFWDGWMTLLWGDVATALGRADKEWVDAEWFRVLEETAEARRDAAEEEEEDALSRRTAAKRKGGFEDVKLKMRKADTMHHDRYNFLSRGRRETYAVWKEDVLTRIDAAGGGHGGGGSEGSSVVDA